ncbi:MAG TPA: hypothetical protein PLZ79_01775 [Burkholderiales bacterium]|nr:hypothetical protein [Burkholderiales bacterium]
MAALSLAEGGNFDGAQALMRAPVSRMAFRRHIELYAYIARFGYNGISL